MKLGKVVDLELKKIKTLVDEGYSNNIVTRRDSADDMVFGWVTQWDDNMFNASDLRFRGEFNQIAKSIRDVIAEMRAMPVDITYAAVGMTTEEQADMMTGIYFTDAKKNMSQEAFFNASSEAITCGVGGWELYTDYETDDSEKQIVIRAPIYEFNNVIYKDPQSTLMDASDARWICKLAKYSKEGYAELKSEIEGKVVPEDEVQFPANFMTPEQSYAFPWIMGDYQWIYVGEFYKRDKINDRLCTFADPVTGETVEYYFSDIDGSEAELRKEGLVEVKRRKCKRYVVTKYLVSSFEILEQTVIPCEYIPIVPQYGERQFVEGQEVWRGLVRLAKDPQRLRNTLLSYAADISMRSNRPKPFFTKKQIAGNEWMYQNSGASNDLPYYLINTEDGIGNPITPPPQTTLPEQKIPDSVVNLIAAASGAVSDVMPTEMNMNYADVDLSGDAIAQLNARINQQSVVFMENRKHAMRRDAEIYASFISHIVDVPQTMVMTSKNGARKKVDVMATRFDPTTGETKRINDLRHTRFEVLTEVGPSFQTQREREHKEIANLLTVLPPGVPERDFFVWKYVHSLTGADNQDAVNYARRQMLIKGYVEPQDEKEMAIVKMAQSQQQKPDPNDIIAQAEMTKANAAMQREQTNALKVQNEMQNHNIKSGVSVADAKTNRMNAHTQMLRVVTDSEHQNADRVSKMAMHAADVQQQQQMQPPKQEQNIGSTQNKFVIRNHPVHGHISEGDIQDTMATHNLSRSQVISKLTHHLAIHKALNDAYQEVA